ncbi:MAG: outer membrane lipoprotein carrier protein [Glaciecola sp.]|jgi:outer membrane lipoprotein carrier protein
MLTPVTNKRFSLIAKRIQAITAAAVVTVSAITMSRVAISAESVELTVTPKTELKIKLSKLISYSASFSQSISDITGKELQSSSGQLTLKTPNMLRWETRLPDETLLIADGTTVYSVDPFVEQVTVMQQASITQNNPLMLLVSDDEKQWNAVTVEKKQSRFIVISSDENANIVSLNIEFNGDQLSRLQSTDRQQQKSLLIFSNIAQNQTVPQSLFLFDIPTNYIIDDQRNQ